MRATKIEETPFVVHHNTGISNQECDPQKGVSVYENNNHFLFIALLEKSVLRSSLTLERCATLSDHCPEIN